ncbi:ribokinase [Jeotgalicoccus meleagridis]|uniref:Ribokinase n=1 Tax=Jeotgalicoccus meleagridis TaxID=2759181 RepID=A0A6V7RFA9_9STAP|nr:ribokinase [Jeotgalicoccus meleagridis]CAD2075690.1 Ribokinase [Jeotgalicoccus meleagridis]HIW38485.1 ribokinase [Candidatus Jeotgalicoccus stercoravium]
MTKPKITIVGSLNMDLVVTAKRHPEIGETLTGQTFSTLCGGKGANQAVAAARLGCDVTFIGKVGNDAFGEEMIENLRNEGINVDHIEKVDDTESGIAMITVNPMDNTVIIVPGANALMTKDVLDAHKDAILNSDIVVTQLEIPMETVDYLATICGENKIDLVVNPAPAQRLTDNIIENSTYITPNQIELTQLADFHPGVLNNYAHKFVVTSGSKGCYYTVDAYKVTVPTRKADVVDTTGAGDCFNGAFVSHIARGQSLEDSCNFANVAASLSVEKFGAQAAMPTMDEVMEKLSSSKK